jgi:hypothetical protein
VSRELVEISTFMVLAEIKDKISAALAAVSTARADNVVNLESPKKYYFYEKVKGLQLPAIFAIANDIDFRQAEKKANYINAYFRLTVVALVEDTREDLLTLKSWRYQAALHDILDKKSLVSASNKTKIKIIVTNATFSPLYSDSGDEGSAAGIFKKESILELRIEHYENQD